MTKENDYIWITDEVDSNCFSMIAPQGNRSWCNSNKNNGVKNKNSIKNEKIIQVAVAVNNSIAENFIDSYITEDKCCTPPVIYPCSCGPKSQDSKKRSNFIKNERILQVAVAVGGSNAQNFVESYITEEGCCVADTVVLPTPGGVKALAKDKEQNVLNKQYNLDKLDGDFNLLINKDGEISINGLKVEEFEEE